MLPRPETQDLVFFDPNRKCLLGIMSRKITSQMPEGDRDIAKYFVPAAAIRDFILAEFRPQNVRTLLSVSTLPRSSAIG
jgi:hypothetical protein